MEISVVKKEHSKDARYKLLYPTELAYRFVTKCRVTGNTRESLGLFITPEAAETQALEFIRKNPTHE